jgi:hypothetical protein
MTYIRVAPRDLFNEANLLKCLGTLWIATDNAEGVNFELEGDRILVEQDESGSIEVVNMPFMFNGQQVKLTRPLNSRNPWPLYATTLSDDVLSVFNDDGKITDEFERFLDMRE